MALIYLGFAYQKLTFILTDGFTCSIKIGTIKYPEIIMDSKKRVSSMIVFSSSALTALLLLFFLIFSFKHHNNKKIIHSENILRILPTDSNVVINKSSINETTDKNAQQRIGTELSFIDKDVFSQSSSIADSALFYSKYSDPREFIKLGWYEGMDYKEVKKTIKEDKLPLLYEMLKDTSYSEYWEKISRIIGYISKDPNSIDALLDYFQRDDSWNWQSSEIPGTLQWINDIAKCERRLRGKVTSLMLIGMIGGTQANLILREAVLEQGAEKLSSAWLKDNMIPASKARLGNKADLITEIRINAIKGLVFSGDGENYKIIKKLYETEEAKCKEYRDSHSFEESLTSCSILHNTLVEVMGKHDYISENSLETYFELLDDKNRSFDTIIPYESKYCSLMNELWKKYQNLIKK
jgi:hypothetical protein